MTLRSIGQLEPRAVLVTTIAIVGAGPAGITLALELADRGIDAIVLEAGGTVVEQQSQQRYEGELTVSDGLEYPPLDVWRLRMLGGTSNHWGGWCRRIEENVFGERPWMDGVAWPFDRDVLEPHYRRAHRMCKLGRDEYDPSTIQADLGITAWPDLDRHGLQSSIWRYSAPIAFGDEYRGELEDSSTDVILGANVVDVATDGDMIRSVTATDGADRVVTVEADAFVIACGGLESVRHLLLLRDRHRLPLDNGGWLGRGFMEHPHGVVGNVAISRYLATDSTGPLSIFRERIPDIDGTDVRAGLTVDPQECAERSLPNMSFTIEPSWSDDVLKEFPSGAGVASLMSLLDGGVGPASYNVYARTEQRLDRESRISLTGGRDDLGLERLRLDWRVPEQDLVDIGTGVAMVADAFAWLGLAVVRNHASTGPLAGITGGAHHMGGARMHDDPSAGVVDADLRVHGVANLSVCSSAVFPAAGYSNPTMTVVALADRHALHLATEAR